MDIINANEIKCTIAKRYENVNGKSIFKRNQ